MRGKGTTAVMLLSLIVATAAPASPSFSPSASSTSELGKAVQQPDLPTIVCGLQRGGNRSLPVMFWLTELTPSGSPTGNAFTDVDPLSEGNLRDAQSLSVASPLPLDEGLTRELQTGSSAAALYFRDSPARAPDPSGAPVLIPLPPAMATGLATLGGAVLIAVRRQLRRRC